MEIRDEKLKSWYARFAAKTAIKIANKQKFYSPVVEKYKKMGCNPIKDILSQKTNFFLVISKLNLN